MTGRAAASAVLLACAIGLLGLGVMRVHRLERAEVEYEGPIQTLREHARAPEATRISARLGSAVLGANQRAVFELCARDGLPREAFEHAFDLAVLQLPAARSMLRVQLDPAHLAHVRRNAQGGCLLIGSGLLEESGTYTVEAIYPAAGPPERALDIPLGVRILARTELTSRDRNLVLGLGLCLLGWLMLQLNAAPAFRLHRDDPIESFTGAALGIVPGLALLASALVFAVSELPWAGPTRTLAKGFLLLALQAGLAWFLIRGHDPHRPRSELLALCRPRQAAAALAAALACWPALVGASMVALRVVPSTGEAPIQTFIAWPSGMLATALLGLVLPLGEELFFRGYLYGALLGYGRLGSAAVNVLVFGSLHAVQSWGNWGGLVSVFAAGLAFLLLRMLTGSVLISAIVHVAYNFTLSLVSLRGAGD